MTCGSSKSDSSENSTYFCILHRYLKLFKQPSHTKTMSKTAVLATIFEFKVSGNTAVFCRTLALFSQWNLS